MRRPSTSSGPRRRVTAFAVGLLALFAAGRLGGSWFGPERSATAPEAPMPSGRGIVTFDEGYRLVPTTPLAAAGGTFRFVVEGPDGRPVTDFTATHERLLHLVVVNHELTAYAHVHPDLASDGTWSVLLPAMPAGSYRVIADFWITGGPHLALGVELPIGGDYRPVPLNAPPDHTVVDGYDVSIEATSTRAGSTTIHVAVSRDGRPVTDLQPHLGAFGHLIAIHDGDLAYAHVHPEGYADGVVEFDASLPAEGRYGLFFEFRHGDAVHLATFTYDQGLVTGEIPMGH